MNVKNSISLSRVINVHQPEFAIIFGRTKRRVDELSHALSIRGYISRRNSW